MMNDSYKNSLSRRKFLEKSIMAGGVVFTGRLIPNDILDGKYEVKNITDERLNVRREGKFPFYKFVSDFNIGEYIPKDQGGKFIQMELIGSEMDKKIVEVFQNGLIEKNLGSPADWSYYEKSELEKSVWFNRFYYLPSFARLYYLEKKSEYLTFMMDTLRNWIKVNPPEGPSKSRYNWFDMQVAWRSINLSWCYYLGKDGLNEEDKEVIYLLQSEHAKILMKDFGKKELNEFNHQSHGALAILYLAILFPSLNEAEELLKTGIKILKHHIENAFYEDGSNVEQMFGYYPFMTSIIRDAYLLCRENNNEDLDSSINLLNKMYIYLSAIAQPDLTVPPINDSYEETVKFVLPTISCIIGFDKLLTPPHTMFFKDSQVGVIRSEINAEDNWYINVNAAKLIGSHAHAGRMAVNFWFNKKPIFVDSGCCNYDNPLLVEWYRTSEAHNTVIIDGKSDLETSKKDVQWAAKRYTNNTITNFIVNRDYKFCRMISPKSDETNSGVEWTRNIILLFDKYFIINDCFETDSEHNYKTIFRLGDVNLDNKVLSSRIIIEAGDKLGIIAENGNKVKHEIRHSYFGTHGKNIKTPTIIYNSDAKGINHQTYVIKKIKDDSDLNKIELVQESDNLTSKIRITDEAGKTVTITINNDKADNQNIFEYE